MIFRSTDLRAALRSRQRGFLLNPARFAGGGGAGGDPSFANVVALLHMDGSDGSTTITDNSPLARTFTANGNAQIDTAQSKFGGASALFDGSGDWVEAATDTGYDLGSTYTIEFWTRPSSVAGNAGLVHRAFYNAIGGNWSQFAFSIRALGTGIRFYFYATTAANEQFIDVSGALAANTWTHIAMVRNGTDGQIFINGVSAGTISGLNTPSAVTRILEIGRWSFSAGIEYFAGHIDELRITKGVARYSSNFTPATAAFPNS